MKKSPYILIAIFLGFSYVSTAQFDDNIITDVLGQDETVSADFINNMITTGRSAYCDPWDDTKPCTDLCDPWDDKPCTGPAISKSTATPEKQEQIIKSTMKHFEEAIADGKGGKFLNKQMLLQAQKKHTGYKLKAIKARFKMYLNFLKKA